jgi:hypothetical protein
MKVASFAMLPINLLSSPRFHYTAGFSLVRRMMLAQRHEVRRAPRTADSKSLEARIFL